MNQMNESPVHGFQNFHFFIPDCRPTFLIKRLLIDLEFGYTEVHAALLLTRGADPRDGG